jgi:hypothetical protein
MENSEEQWNPKKNHNFYFSKTQITNEEPTLHHNISTQSATPSASPTVANSLSLKSPTNKKKKKKKKLLNRAKQAE